MNSDSIDSKSTAEISNQVPRFVVGLGASAGGLDSVEKSVSSGTLACILKAISYCEILVAISGSPYSCSL